MPLFVMTLIDRPGALDLRMATREAHLAYVRERLEMVKLAGPLLDAAGGMVGSLFIMEAPDQGAVEAFRAEDPYTKAGLFERVEIRPFRATVGGLA
jgi:uncharacterized protein YciI